MSAHRVSSQALLFVTTAVTLVGGGFWWKGAAPVPVTSHLSSYEPSPFVSIMVVDRDAGRIIFDERQPVSPLERAVSFELPCGALRQPGMSFSRRLWAAHQATATHTLCSYVHYRGRLDGY